jgi:hypothetical protein
MRVHQGLAPTARLFPDCQLFKLNRRIRILPDSFASVRSEGHHE